MRKILATISLAAILTGCASGTVIRKNVDGSQTAMTFHRLLWKSEGTGLVIYDNGTNGFGATLIVAKSAADAKALGVTAEGVARGMKGF